MSCVKKKEDYKLTNSVLPFEIFRVQKEEEEKK